MRSKTFSIVTVAAVSFALVLGLGAFNAAKAVSGQSGERIAPPAPGVVDIFGADGANNTVRTVPRDSDASTKFAPDTYGVHNTLRP